MAVWSLFLQSGSGGPTSISRTARRLRLHGTTSPLIEPEVPISEVRLSDWLHRKAHGDAS